MSRAANFSLLFFLLPPGLLAADLPFFGHADFGLQVAAQAFDARTHQHPYRNHYDRHSHTPEGFALDELFVVAANVQSGGFLTLKAADAAQRDGRFAVSAGKFGKFAASASFATIPSLFMHSTRTPFANLGHGRLVVDEAIRRDLETAPDVDLAARAQRVLTNSPNAEIGYRRNSLGARALWRPAETIELRVGVRDETRNGSRPFSLGAFDVVPSGFSIVMFEIAEPIERRTNEVTGGVTFRGRQWHIDIDGSASRFRNTIAFIDYDNPFRFTHAAANDDGLTGRMRASRGHITSAPNTTGRSLRASGAFAIGERAHAGASVTWIGITQDQRFVPWTLNLAIPGSGLPEGLGPTNAEGLPRPSLQGRATSLSTDDSLALIITDDITLTLRYRDYDFNNRTADLTMPGIAGAGDSTWITEIDGAPIVAVGHSYRRQTAQTDLVWEREPFRARLAHEREIWSREPRRAGRTEEDSVTGAVQFRSKEWQARTLARYRRRSGLRDAVTFDTTDLDRFDATAFGVWMPSDRLSATANLLMQRSDHGGAAALRHSEIADASLAVRFAFDESLDATARISRDSMRYAYEHAEGWGRDVRDGSIATGIEISKSAGRFSARAGWETAHGNQSIEAIGTRDTWPPVRTSWQRVDTEFEMELTPRWTTGVRYRYSPFSLDDYATDDLSVYPFDEISPLTDARRVILLDARYDGHEVHALALYFRLTSR